EMRRTLGTAVFSGMIGVTFFGIFLTPVFYYVVIGLTGTGKDAPKSDAAPISMPTHDGVALADRPGPGSTAVKTTPK
ncbi:MAG: hypothetical protein ACRD36_06180, partial [Candidatus Acidiferrum sp.]